MFLKQARGQGLAILLVGTALSLALSLINLAAGPQTPTSFQPNEPVESIRMELVVGNGGEDLDEPIALDLGLGFPLWLQKIGQVESYVVPFGAAAQSGVDQPAIPAGGTGTFEFSLKHPAGLDDLGSVPQLLAGMRVSDKSNRLIENQERDFRCRQEMWYEARQRLRSSSVKRVIPSQV